MSKSDLNLWVRIEIKRNSRLYLNHLVSETELSVSIDVLQGGLIVYVRGILIELFPQSLRGV